jgi:hypothetical protein
MHGAPPAAGARGTQSSWRRQRVRSSCRRRELAARVVELAGARAAAPCGARVARELLPQGRVPTSARPGAEPLAAGSGSPQRRGPLLPVARAHRCARDSLRTELADGNVRTELAGGQGFTPRGQVRELTGGAGRRSPTARRRSFGRRSWWPTGKVSGLLQVYVVCVGDVSEEYCNVSCECCKSGSRRCDVVTIFRHMLYVY